MNKIFKSLQIIKVLFLFVVSVSYGQDTTYYTNDGLKLLSIENADYYEVNKENDIYSSKIDVFGYYVSGQRKSSKTIILTNKNLVVLKKAKAIWSIDGQCQEWFENGKLKMTVKYSEGKRVGELKTYWENGNVKRKDNYEDVEQLFSFEKFIDGKCFNEEGKKMVYFPYYQSAKFPGGSDSLNVFISRNIKNDLKDSLDYRNVKFDVNRKGEIDHVQIEKKNSSKNTINIRAGVETKKMEDEIIRVISSMPRWNPALIDGEPVGEQVNKGVFYGKIFDKDGIYTLVEKMPEYKWGISAMSQYISENLKYPVLAWQNKIAGKVILRFVVTKNGSIGKVTVVRGIGSGCDEEAIRIIKNLSDWIPGTLNGTPVNVNMTLPISFNLK